MSDRPRFAYEAPDDPWDFGRSKKNTPAANILRCVILLLFVGLIFYYKLGSDDWKLAKRCKAETAGVVTAVNERPYRKGGHEYYNYAAVVEPDEKGLFPMEELRSRETKHKYAEGDRVRISYDPAEPSFFYIEYAEPDTSLSEPLYLLGGVVVMGALAFAGRKRCKTEQ